MEQIEESKSRRTHEQLRRVLCLMQLLAAYRFPKTINQLWDEVHEFYGCRRTLERDLRLLVDVGMVKVSRSQIGNKTSMTTAAFQINPSTHKTR